VRVLVTGASGLLGGGVARVLAGRGERVTVLQRRPSGLAGAGPGRLGLVEVLADVSDHAAVRRAAEDHDAVVHLAAKVNVTGRWSDYERVNVGGTQAVIDACRAAGVPRLVYVSSPSVTHAGRSLAGQGAGVADPERARGSYARSKAVAERLALGADGEHLAVLAVRPHLVWGPGDRQLVARIVERARAGRLPVIGSGAALVDSTYIDNAVHAVVAAVDRCGAGPAEAHGEALVVTNGEPRPIGELVGDLCAAAGAPRPHRHVPVPLALAVGAAVQSVWGLADRVRPGRISGDPPMTRFVVEQMSTAHWFDQRRTRELLRWTPAISLDEGLDRLRRWYAAAGRR
jgi:nucleoside-diphosphate-sugar epimerase